MVPLRPPLRVVYRGRGGVYFLCRRSEKENKGEERWGWSPSRKPRWRVRAEMLSEVWGEEGNVRAEAVNSQ